MKIIDRFFLDSWDCYLRSYITSDNNGDYEVVKFCIESGSIKDKKLGRRSTPIDRVISLELYTILLLLGLEFELVISVNIDTVG